MFRMRDSRALVVCQINQTPRSRRVTFGELHVQYLHPNPETTVCVARHCNLALPVPLIEDAEECESTRSSRLVSSEKTATTIRRNDVDEFQLCARRQIVGTKMNSSMSSFEFEWLPRRPHSNSIFHESLRFSRYTPRCALIVLVRTYVRALGNVFIFLVTNNYAEALIKIALTKECSEALWLSFTLWRSLFMCTFDSFVVPFLFFILRKISDVYF